VSGTFSRRPSAKSRARAHVFSSRFPAVQKRALRDVRVFRRTSRICHRPRYALHVIRKRHGHIAPGAQVALFADDTLFLTKPSQFSSAPKKSWPNSGPVRSNEKPAKSGQTKPNTSESVIGRRLEFNNHIKNITKKATTGVRGNATSGFKPPIPLATRRIHVYKTYVSPIRTHAGAAWAPYTSTTQWKHLDDVQTIGLGTIAGVRLLTLETTSC